MTKQLTDAERARLRARLDRELGAAARRIAEEAGRIVNQLKEEMRESMKTLLGG